MFIGPDTKALVNDIVGNYQNWCQGHYTYTNKETNISIWTGNGLFYIDFYPNISAFNIFEKALIKTAIKKSIILKCIC